MNRFQFLHFFISLYLGDGLVKGYKITTQKSIAFVYANNVMAKKQIVTLVSFIIDTKEASSVV